jgi:hypothetical protein
VKCVNNESATEPFEQMLKEADGHRISIHAGYWPAGDVRDLMAACDAYVSLHRSEGTGLTISEAMALGKPVIATGWSGNMDFMTVANSFPVRYQLRKLDQDFGPYRKGEVWAEPSVQHAAEAMRAVYERKGDGLARAARAAEDMQSLFSEQAIGGIVRERLAVIGRLRPKTVSGMQRSSVAFSPGPALGYRRLVGDVRAAVQDSTPVESIVAVISRGDPDLIDFEGRVGWHFPRGADGEWPGYYPKEDEAAVAHLESLRSDGAGFFAIPNTAFWWLDQYPAFAEHLESTYRVVRGDESCRIYDLGSKPGRSPRRAGKLKHARHPSHQESDVLPAQTQTARFTQQTLKELDRRVSEQEGRLEDVRSEAAAATIAASTAQEAAAASAGGIGAEIRRLAERVRMIEARASNLAERADRQQARIQRVEQATESGSAAKQSPDRSATRAARPSRAELRRRREAVVAAEVRTVENMRRVVVLAPRAAPILEALSSAGLKGMAVTNDPTAMRRLQARDLAVEPSTPVAFLRSLTGRTAVGIVVGDTLDSLAPDVALALLV